MVPFVGVLTSLLVSLAIRLYLRFWCAQGNRNPAFERFCASKPLVFAFFCPRTGGDRLLQLLNARLGRHHPRVNVEGVFPWPFYRLTLEAERLNDCVVGVRVAGVAMLRGQQTAAPLLALVEQLCAEDEGIAEVWLHGDLYSHDERCEPEMTWRGFPRAGAVTLHAYAELPFWLRPFHGRGPRDRDRNHRDAADEAAVGVLVEG